MLTKEEFLKAIQIISANHSTELKINLPTNGFVGDKLGNMEFNLTITKCYASVINNLTGNGYSLSMTPDGLSVDKY